MEPLFQYRKYAEENSDLAAEYGMDDEATLFNHFTHYGKAELRGAELSNTFRLEGLIISDCGDILVAGWADRRMLAEFHLEIEIGYLRQSIEFDVMCWYHRPDVSALTGDARQSSGFVAMTRMKDMVLHPRVRVYLNGRLVRDEPTTRWLSQGQFLKQALSATAVLADQPVGRTLRHARFLTRPFQDLWQDVVRAMRFTLAFDGRRRTKVDRSIVIVLHRASDMLLVQLQTLAAYLECTNTEVILVGNDLADPNRVISDLTAFCQLYDAEISLYVSSRNAGFSTANNFGETVARGDTLILMNPDIFPAEHDPTMSLSFLDRDPEGRLHGALLYYGDGSLMHSGMYVAADHAYDDLTEQTIPVLRVEHFGKGLMDRIDDPNSGVERIMAPLQGAPVLASAALWKMPRTLYHELGGLSDDYIYAYYEDADFCMRLLESGGEICIDPSARWLHLEGVGKARQPHMRSFMWLNRSIFSERFANSRHVADKDLDLADL